jgi:HK97 family phage portal protein
MAKAPIRLRLAKAILGSHAKDFIPPLSSFDGYSSGLSGRLNDYVTKSDQLKANLGWCFAANNAIADPTAAVELKLYRKLKNGKREEIIEHELLDLLDAPNAAHTGEQLRHLHFTYMNYVGESYLYLRDLGGNPYEPKKNKLPAAMEIFPAHQVQFTLGDNGRSYSQSTVHYGNDAYPLFSFIRDLNPDPEKPYFGRSIVRAAALTIDTENQMKEWNRSVFANSARPSLIFNTNEPLEQEAYDRWKAQFTDQHTGTENAYKPLLVEGGDAKAYMLNQQDLDFLAGRKFSMTEILSMWRVSPGMLGQLESANRANLEAAFLINAIINVKPRIRQFVKQLNATLVKVYDPTLELDFEDPVPDDVEAKLNAAKAGVDKWWTKDEIREQYGDKPLPDKLGSEIYMANNNAKLSAIAEGTAKPASPVPAGGVAASGDAGTTDTTPPAGDSGTKAFRYKQVSAGQFPGLYDDLDIDLDMLGCIMLDTETIKVTKFVEDGAADLIQPTADGKHQRGAVAEREAHVTLLFGLLENGNIWKDKVDTLLEDWSLDNVTIKDVTAFDLGDSYAIVGLIKKTPELIDGHERLTLLPHIQTFSEYKPHLTLAYVEHDEAVRDKWVKALRAEYKGTELKTKGINYGDKPEASKSLSSPSGVKKKT